MFRINSISPQIITQLMVVEGGVEKPVDLLPKNFVYSEAFTSQMKNLEFNKFIRVREVDDFQVANAIAQNKKKTKR